MPKRRVQFYLTNEATILSSLTQKLINYNGYSTNIEEYNLLEDHINKGGSVQDTEYFYKILNKIGSYNYGRGYDLIYTYVRNVIRGRLPFEVEKVLFSSVWGNYRASKFGYKYAKYVVRGRLPAELEVGCKNYDYVKFLMNKNIEYANLLINSSHLAYAFYRCEYFLPEIVHNSMIAKQLAGDAMAKLYFKQRKKDDKIIKNRLRNVEGGTTIADYVRTLN